VSSHWEIFSNKEGNNINYTIIAALSYRQAFAGTKLVWNPVEKVPWYFLKEISSDGDLSTVDVIFPAYVAIKEFFFLC
jgi:hypothetical protein